MQFNNTQFFFLVGAVAVAGGLVYLNRDKLLAKVDITSDKNLAYSGVNAVGETLSGERDWALGTALWRFMNPQAVENENKLLGGG